MSEENPINEQPVTEKTTAEVTASQQPVAETTAQVTERMVEPMVKHDDFDWEGSNEAVSPYGAAEFAELEKLYGVTFTEFQDNEIIKARVEAFTKSDVVLDIGFKSDGLISISEFRDTPDLKVGDDIEVYVVTKENEHGQLVLSRKNAKLVRAWDNIVDASKTDKIIKGTVVSKTKGGLIVDIQGLETFLPGSQIDVKPITDYDAYVGKTMEFKVVKINETIKNAVVSHKALIESDLEAQRGEIMAKMEKGQVLEGVIKNITDFGAFIDLGGIDGLLYITDISWGRINHPSDVLEVNQTLNVVVLDFDDNKKRISLGHKQLQPHPWDALTEELKIGDTVKGKIVNIEDYGAFLEIAAGVEGLVHVSEVSWSNQPINSREFFKLNDELEAKIVTIDKEDRKMSLSVKQLSPDPWQEISTRFPVGSKHAGLVRNITPYGVFVELEEGIGGMVHISDLSWTKRFNHPSEFTRVDKNLEIVILEIDEEARKLSMGHKQIEEDPWDTFENVFPVGSKHQGTIIRKDDKGGIVSLPYGLEAFAPNRFLKKEDNSSAALDESLEFVVIEFGRNEKRIIVSHTSTLKQADGTIPTITAAPKKENKQKTSQSSNYASKNKIEKTTLGDLDVLSQLKAKMEEGEVKPAAQVTPAKEEPKAEAPKVEAPKVEAPKVEAPKVEAPKVEAPKVEAPKVEDAAKVVAAAAVTKVAADATSGTTEVKKTVIRRIKQDLTKVEGIGPKTEELLNAKRIYSFEDLSKTSVDDIKGILADAGGVFKSMTPDTWPKQSEMAHEEKWDELKKWQDELDGGK